MRLHRRVAWLTVISIAVGLVSALAGLVNYATAKAHLEYGPLGSDPPEPSVAEVLGKYWWGWVGLLVVWISFVLLARRALRAEAGEPGRTLPDQRSAMKVIVGALVATLGTIAAVCVGGSYEGWF